MREVVFHKLWENYSFSSEDLRTTCGKSIKLIDNGRLNSGDGPDFLFAKIEIDGIILHGSVELHLSCGDWYLHKHDRDPRYNNTVLHVALGKTGASPVHLQDGTTAPTLVLYEYLDTGWQHQILQKAGRDNLQCRGMLHDISPLVVNHQINRSADFYFAEKRKTILTYYDTKLSPSEAWLKMFFAAWCDGLGISHNREPMKILAGWMWDNYPSDADITEDFIFEKMLNASGLGHLGSAILSKKQWDYSGGRPANHPEIRIKQAARMLYYLRTNGFSHFLNQDSSLLISRFKKHKMAGQHRLSVLIFTVLVPALHILGGMMVKESLCSFAINYWKNETFPVNNKITEFFSELPLQKASSGKSIGLVYQERSLCRVSKCESCLIFKSAFKG